MSEYNYTCPWTQIEQLRHQIREWLLKGFASCYHYPALQTSKCYLRHRDADNKILSYRQNYKRKCSFVSAVPRVESLLLLLVYCHICRGNVPKNVYYNPVSSSKRWETTHISSLGLWWDEVQGWRQLWGWRAAKRGGRQAATALHFNLSFTLLNQVNVFNTLNLNNWKEKMGNFNLPLTSRRWYPSQPRGLEFDNYILSSVEMPL